MSAGSIGANNHALIAFHHDKRADGEQKTSLTLKQLSASTFAKRAESLMDSLPYEILGAHLGISDPGRVKKLLPNSENLKIFRCGAALYLHIAFNTATHKCLEAQASSSLEWLALTNEPGQLQSSPTDYSYLQRATRTQFQTETHKFFQYFVAWFETQFGAVGVKSYSAFERKSLLIKQTRELAELQYLSIRENFERRKALDLALFEEYPIQQDDRRMLINFWGRLLEAPEGPQIHQLFENQFKELLTACLERIHGISEELQGKLIFKLFQQKAHFTHEGQPFDFPNRLYEEIFSSMKYLLQMTEPDLSTVRSSDKNLAGKYFFLKANMALTLLCKREIRRQLEPMCDEIQNAIRQITTISLTQRQHMTPLISHYKAILEIHDALANNTECNHPRFAELKACWIALPESERKFEIVKPDGTRSEGVESIREALQTLGNIQELSDEEYVRRDLAEEWLFGEGPQRYQTMLEQAAKTSAESFFVDSYAIVLGNEAFNQHSRGGILQDIDMGCDLSVIEDPLEYFRALICERDERRLALILNLGEQSMLTT